MYRYRGARSHPYLPGRRRRTAAARAHSRTTDAIFRDAPPRRSRADRPSVRTYVRRYRTGLSREIESAIFAARERPVPHTRTNTHTHTDTYTYTRVSLSGALTVALFRNDMHAAGRKIPADYAPSALLGAPGQKEREKERRTTREEPEPELLPEREKVKRGRRRGKSGRTMRNTVIAK